MAYGLNSYKRTNIQTADLRKIIVLLYEGAIGRLNKAVASIEAGQRQDLSAHINKTLEIIKFLSNALDFEKGGPLANNLSMLYDYMRDALLMANIEGDVEKIREVLSLLNTLLEGWRGILEQSPAEATANDGNGHDAAISAVPEAPAGQSAFPETDAAPAPRKRLSLVG